MKKIETNKQKKENFFQSNNLLAQVLRMIFFGEETRQK